MERDAVRAAAMEPPVWVRFGEFWFDPARSDIRSADREKIDAIATLLRGQPALRVVLDGTMREREGGRDLGHERVAKLREALLRLGVAAERIVAGDAGRPGLRHAQRVEVLLGPG